MKHEIFSGVPIWKGSTNSTMTIDGLVSPVRNHCFNFTRLLTFNFWLSHSGLQLIYHLQQWWSMRAIFGRFLLCLRTACVRYAACNAFALRSISLCWRRKRLSFFSVKLFVVALLFPMHNLARLPNFIVFQYLGVAPSVEYKSYRWHGRMNFCSTRKRKHALTSKGQNCNCF